MCINVCVVNVRCVNVCIIVMYNIVVHILATGVSAIIVVDSIGVAVMLCICFSTVY